MSVHTHVLSPLGPGLYRGAIAQSGTADMILLENRGDREEQFSSQLAIALNCSHTNHTQEMLECMQEADISNLLTVVEYDNYNESYSSNGDDPSHWCSVVGCDR